MKKETVKFIAPFCLAALLVLLLPSCGVSNGQNANAISSVLYDTRSENLKITATLDNKTAREYKHETIYLMEVPANNSVADIVTLIPVGKAKAEKKMDFTVALRNGSKTCLYSGFVLAAFDQTDGYVALGDVRYIDNPETLAKNTSDYPTYMSVKGLYITSLSDAAALGVRHTVIRIPVEEYITVDSDTAKSIACTFDGNTFYLNSSKIAELDYKIKNLTDSGIEIYLEFTLDTSPDDLPDAMSFLASKPRTKKTDTTGIAAAAGSNDTDAKQGDATENTSDTHYALSLDSGESYENLAAFFEFIAARYTREDGQYGFAGAYIVGHGVNSLGSTNIDSARTLADAADSYGSLLRLAATALRSNYANGKVYVSINNIWNEPDSEKLPTETRGDVTAATTSEPSAAVTTVPDTANSTKTSGNSVSANVPRPTRTEFGGGEYLLALAKNLAKSGNFDYGIAVMPNASDTLSSAVWMDEKAVKAQNTVCLTVKNLSVLTEFLGRETMLCGENTRNILLYNYGISSTTPEAMAASYAYAYYKAVEAGAEAFIYNGQWDGATGNSESGLWQTDTSGEPTEKRPIYNTFKDIDVKDAGESAEAKARIGAEWATLYQKFGEQVRTALASRGSAVTTPDMKTMSKLSDKLLFDFSDGNSFGFYPSDSAEYVEISDDTSGGKILNASLYPRYKGELTGIRSGENDYEIFEKAKIITVALRATTPDSNTSKVTLALSQANENGSCFFTASATVQADNWQTVYFNLDDLKLDKNFGAVKVWLWLEADGIPVRGGGAAVSSSTDTAKYAGTNGTDDSATDGTEGDAGSNTDTKPNVLTNSTGYSIGVKSLSVASKKSSAGFVWTLLVIILLVGLGYIFYRYITSRSNGRADYAYHAREYTKPYDRRTGGTGQGRQNGGRRVPPSRIPKRTPNRAPNGVHGYNSQTDGRNRLQGQYNPPRQEQYQAGGIPPRTENPQYGRRSTNGYYTQNDPRMR